MEREMNDHEINIYIGQRIKLRRNMLGITQKQLAQECGVTFQQIQKYEAGETRIMPERLYRLGCVLDIPVSFLFAGMPKQTPVGDAVSINGPMFAKSPGASDPLARNESLEMIKLFWALPEDKLRDNILTLMRSMQ